MKPISHTAAILVATILWAGTLAAAATAADGDAHLPSPQDALKFVPTQDGVDYDRPDAGEAAKCTIAARKFGTEIGLIVESPAGVILRRFTDTDGDGTVNQWSYYKDGLEVYRDVDSNANQRVDQCRWFHTAGSRWGLDRDEDGRIDQWKTISPEEVSAEVVAALAGSDAARFMRVALAPADIETLGLGPQRAKELQEQLGSLRSSFEALARQQKTVGSSTRWLHFSGGQPGVVPSGTGGSTKDLLVYEDAVALVENEGKTSEVLLGTLVRVGDTWRVIDAPRVDGSASATGGVSFFSRGTSIQRPSVAGGASDDKIQDLLAQLEKIDQATHQDTSGKQAPELNAKRADLLEQIAASAATPEDRAMWLRQLADTVGAAVHAGAYPAGAKRLAALHDKLAKNPKDEDLAAYVRFRQMAAEQTLSYLGAKTEDYQKIQDQWVASLKQFIKEYPKAKDTSEAMLQLAMMLEFSAEEAEAKDWYARLVKDFPGTPAAEKAAGAQRRLDSVGKTLTLTGKTVTGQTIDLAQYRGKAVVIQYWATSSGSATRTDIAVLKELLSKYGNQLGVIGVNLDVQLDAVTAFLKENRVPWPQIFEEGGLDSRPANEMGIITLPTMILVSPEGKVVRRNIDVAELDQELKKLLR